MELGECVVMKTNEIIQEGPLDFAKNMVAGFKGAKAGYNQSAATNAQKDKTNAIVKKAIDQWNATAGQIAQGGTQATGDQAVQWLTKFLGKAPAGKPAGDSPAQISQFITQEITQHIANRATQGLGGATAPAATDATTAPAAPGATPPPTAPAADATAPATAPAADATAPAEPATPAAAPAKPGANEFAQKLQADFEQFSSAGGSIGAPAVKQVIKNMWMQAGGTKAESKKNKKKPV